jgi:uncharacterized protein (UPF0332 family)
VTPADLMDKAKRASASAELLLNAGDPEGACNRAYYAMFDAARAALIASRPGADADAEMAKVRTHSGLITAFGLRLVKTGRLPVELGRALNRASELRLAADYTGGPVTKGQAEWMVNQSKAFIAEVHRAFTSPEGEP